MEEENKNIPKHRDKLVALDNLSLGISIVVAVLMGAGIGYALMKWLGYTWLLWLGLVWGIGAAGLNIYRAYKRAQKEYEGMEDDPRYAYRAKHGYNDVPDDKWDDDKI